MNVLRERRIAAGLTKKELAEAANLPKRTIESWEEGGIYGARLEAACRVADVLGIWADQLLTFDHDAKETPDESDD